MLGKELTHFEGIDGSFHPSIDDAMRHALAKTIKTASANDPVNDLMKFFFANPTALKWLVNYITEHNVQPLTTSS